MHVELHEKVKLCISGYHQGTIDIDSESAENVFT